MATSTPTPTTPSVQTCPACGTEGLRWGAPDGAPWHGRCRDCGIVYTRDGSIPQSVCPGCGLPHSETETGCVFCEDCGPSDCAGCGRPTLRWQLDEDLLLCPFCNEVVCHD
jgi:hypothetical protein